MADRISEEELMLLIKKLNVDAPQSPLADSDRERAGTGTSSAEEGWIKVENNKIIVQDPGEGGKFPVIQAVHPVKLKKNGKPLTDKDIVESKDMLEWEVEEQPLFKIEVSPDKMTATFRLISNVRYAWRLKDKGPSAYFLLEAEEDRNVVIETLNLTTVMNALQKMRITKNLKPALIYQELQNPTHKPIVIAQGIPPTPSKDSRLELYFSENVESSFEEIGGTVDFRNHLRIPSVKKGELIARKIPLVEGTPGFDVYGNIVKPVPPKDIIIVAKDHVEITPNGEVIALKEGRPRVTGTTIKYFDISPAYVVYGDVDLRTGNIVFSGDVVVYGDVTDGMIIESLGNVYVSGNVYRATISATGSICIKGNTIGSNLYSGYFGVIFNRLYGSSKKLAELLQSLTEAAKLLTGIVESRGKSVSLGQVLITLMESKFREIPATVKDIMVTIANIQNINAGEMAELKSKLELFLHPLRILEVPSLNHLHAIRNLLQETYLTIERMQENQVQIDITQCHLSHLKSNGDIFIRREGVLQSQLYSKGNIVFFDTDSVCRGSQLEAGGMISAGIIGGETGGDTILKAGNMIRFKKMYGGRVCVGKYGRDILEPIENVNISVHQHHLVFQQEVLNFQGSTRTG